MKLINKEIRKVKLQIFLLYKFHILFHNLPFEIIPIQIGNAVIELTTENAFGAQSNNILKVYRIAFI
ncbi:MAG: hypothetical protein ACJAVE_000328 [Polaribacter sp.]|jgi:hypothetical protein|tara:strand:+ start:659 stop:859 length:201 start_codon:yes stop_codon:yes gene_type:complete